MLKKSLSVILFIILFTFFPSNTASAQQRHPTDAPSYFSTLKNYLIAFTVIDNYNKRVLAASTTAPGKQPQQSQQKITQTTSISSYLLQAVNVYRTSLGLSPAKSSTETCAFAQLRAEEINKTFSHDGFNTRVSNRTLPYTAWSRATENIAEAPDYKEVVTLWKNSPGHAANMRDNTPYICITKSGNYYAYEGMRP